MALQITTHQNMAPVIVYHTRELAEVLEAASAEARARNILGAVLLRADNGNVMTMVVGGEETVLSFDYSHQNPPYFVSRGVCSDDDPAMTCYVTFQHHSEFSRKHVIPFTEGLNAAMQFLKSNSLPSCISWEEL